LDIAPLVKALADRYAREADLAATQKTATSVDIARETALAWLDCTIHARYPAGSHTIYVGTVEASSVPKAEAPPLIYWNRGYRKLRLHEES